VSNHSVPEADCLRRIAAGEDAWGDFWDLFGRIIEFEVNRFLGSGTEGIDDVYQNLVLKLLDRDYRIICKHLDSGSSTGFGALVRRITRNMLIDQWRTRKRKGVLDLLDFESHPEYPGSKNANPANHHQRNWQINELLLAAANRNKNSSTFKILFLRFVDGESVRYIAGEMGMKEDTIRHRIDYNLKKLRKKHGDALKVMSHE